MTTLDAEHAAAHEERAGAHQALEQEVLSLVDARAVAANIQRPGGGGHMEAIIAEKAALQQRLADLEKQQQVIYVAKYQATGLLARS